MVIRDGKWDTHLPRQSEGSVAVHAASTMTLLVSYIALGMTMEKPPGHLKGNARWVSDVLRYVFYERDLEKNQMRQSPGFNC